jgi:GTP-binding protein
MNADNIRNVAIIAHVDHGKTTLVDRLLHQSGMFRDAELQKLAGSPGDLIMDSNPLERERGITIFSKNCAIRYTALDGKTIKINIIDTPGHADFGGEVERVLKMADGVLLVVDAFEGPMPQTRFVLEKALQNRMKCLVVVNKIDRRDARPEMAVNEVFELFMDLGADDEALDFPVIYTSAKEGWSTFDLKHKTPDMRPLFEAIVKYIPAPAAAADKPLQMLVTALDYSDYVGRIAIGRVFAGQIARMQDVTVIDRHGVRSRQKVQQVFEFEGLSRKEVETIGAGDICAVVGLQSVGIGETITDVERPIRLPPIAVGEPTLNMTFRVNDGPFAGRDGIYLTSRHLRERLDRELQTNVALRVEPGDTPAEFKVSGRGLLHLGVLLENMRRDGYELCVGKPRVILREINGKIHEPVETLVIECPQDCQSAVISIVGTRRAELARMDHKPGVHGYLHMEYLIPSRGIIGLRSKLLNATQGRAVMYHVFERYEPMRGPIPQRTSGVMIATHTGQVTGYALSELFDRGPFFVKVGEYVYEGQIVGEHSKEKDIGVNVTRAKEMSNVRTSGRSDTSLKIRATQEMPLETALEYIQEDELVEITPKAVRMRKILLTDVDRRRQKRSQREQNAE